MGILGYRSAQFFLLSLLSWSQASPLATFYCALVLQSLAVHQGIFLSLAVCLMGVMATPAYAWSLLVLWICSAATRRKLYVRYERPDKIVLMIFGIFLLGAVITSAPCPRFLQDTTCATALAVSCHLNAGLAWQARKSRALGVEGLSLIGIVLALSFTPRSYQIGALCFTTLLQIRWIARLPQWLAPLLACKLFFLTNQAQLLWAGAVIFHSLTSASQGLHYDSLYTPPLNKRAGPRAQRYFSALPFRETLFTLRR